MYTHTHTHTYVKLNHFVVHLKLKQHGESITLQFFKRFWNVLHRKRVFTLLTSQDMEAT